MLLAASSLPAKVLDKTAEIAGMTLHYKVALPNEFDPANTYPAVLAFPPGSQDMQMVLTTLVQNWLPEQGKRGYIVVIPAAPYNRPFVGEGAKVFPEFIERLLHDYKIRDNKFHVAGMSNGGQRLSHCCVVSAVLPVGHRISRLPSGRNARSNRRAGEDVHLYARRRYGYRMGQSHAAAGLDLPG